MDETHAFLTARILHDKQVVTYRVLSRALGLHVDEAKAALQRFFHSTTSSGSGIVQAVYTVHGPHAVHVVCADKLEDTLAQQQLGPTTTKQVYALQPGHMAYDAALLAAMNRALACDAAYARQREAGLSAFGAIHLQGQQVGARPQGDEQAMLPTEPTEADARKRRKVIKKVRTKNEKGYTVFQDIETYESCSDADDNESAIGIRTPFGGREPPKRVGEPTISKPTSHESNTSPKQPEASHSAKPPAAPAPPPKKSSRAAGGSAAPKQHSLLSFFGKR